MGQKANPIGLRLGIIKGWDSNWYGGKNFSDKLVEDYKIRTYLKARLAKASISKIVIERTVKIITVTINTSRPGIIIGKGGQEVDKIKEEIKKITKKDENATCSEKDTFIIEFEAPHTPSRIDTKANQPHRGCIPFIGIDAIGKVEASCSMKVKAVNRIL